MVRTLLGAAILSLLLLTRTPFARCNRVIAVNVEPASLLAVLLADALNRYGLVGLVSKLSKLSYCFEV
jgi:hypothetical protein